MDTINVASDKSLFLGAAPAFDSMLPLKCLLVRFDDHTPYKFHRPTTKCIRRRVGTCYMLIKTTIQIFCESSVICIIRALKDIDSVWYKWYVSVWLALRLLLRVDQHPLSARGYISSRSFNGITFSSYNSSISSANLA